MKRVLRVFLMALLLGTPVGMALVPADAACQDVADCCPDGSDCDADCVACACCPGQCSSIMSSAVKPEFVGVPPARANSTGSRAVVPLLSTDILHVPKSV